MKTPTPAFKFLLVYEDRPAGLRAKEMSDRIAARLEPDCQVSNEAWNFALLADPQLRELASADARHADMVIISAHTVTTLPDHVRSWLQQWLPLRKDAQSAFVVLLGQHDQHLDNSPTQDFLILHNHLSLPTSSHPNIIPLHNQHPLSQTG